jgi:leader peptidase (prepilin peptidase)/N-methyltransferase
VINVLAGAFGVLGALVAHDLAAQALADQPLRPLAGTCPRCGAKRGWVSLVCGSCGRRVGREALVILVSVVFAAGFANTIGGQWALLAYLGFLVLTLALAITDFDSLRIVDRLNLRGSAAVIAALGLAAVVDGSGPAFLRGLLGGVAYFAGTNLLFLIVGGRGFGYGDVKISVQLGVFTTFLSWGTLGWAVLITALVGGLASIVVLAAAVTARLRARRTTEEGSTPTIGQAMKVELPYGPAMILGSWISITLAGLGAFPVPT